MTRETGADLAATLTCADAESVTWRGRREARGTVDVYGPDGQHLTGGTGADGRLWLRPADGAIGIATLYCRRQGAWFYCR